MQMSKSRFAVIPPNTSEDFGLVALEARKLGLPCLITNDGGLPEAAGIHCLTCEPGNVKDLARILIDAANMPEEKYNEMSEGACHTLESCLTRPKFYVETYLNML